MFPGTVVDVPFCQPVDQIARLPPHCSTGSSPNPDCGPANRIARYISGDWPESGSVTAPQDNVGVGDVNVAPSPGVIPDTAGDGVSHWISNDGAVTLKS